MNSIEALPLFPLSDVVLLPAGSVPLFIFEPRYRQMTRDALGGARQIGMVTVHPDAVTAMAGDPAIFQVGCLGRIAHAQERPDGTFHILLVAEARFRILEEIPRSGDRLYRSARVALLEDTLPESPEQFAELTQRRTALLTLLSRYVRSLGEAVDDPDGALTAFERVEPHHLVNAIAQSIPLRPVERQQILESDSLLDRYEIAADLLRFKLAESGAGETTSRSLPN
jgi:uncharacterized protein